MFVHGLKSDSPVRKGSKNRAHFDGVNDRGALPILRGILPEAGEIGK